MKTSANLRKSLLLVAFITPFLSFTADLQSQADELFKQSRYYDAFFIYRQLFGNVIDQNEPALRCSHAMSLTRQYENYRAFGKTLEAKTSLKELIVLNPYDFHKPELAKMTFDEGFYFQRLAHRQQSPQENNLMLDKAVVLYQEAQNYGYDINEVKVAIKQCDALKEPITTMGSEPVKQQNEPIQLNTIPQNTEDSTKKESELMIKTKVE